MQKVGSSSPFPAYQQSPSPRYHPHSQREDHGDVEYTDDNPQPVHRMMLPKTYKDNNLNNDQKDEDDLRQEKLEQSQASTTYDDQRGSEESNLKKTPDEGSNIWRENENISKPQDSYSFPDNNLRNENQKRDRSDESEELLEDTNKNNYSSSQNIDKNTENFDQESRDKGGKLQSKDRDQNQRLDDNEELEKSDVQQSNKQNIEERDIDRDETEDVDLKRGENTESRKKEGRFQEPYKYDNVVQNKGERKDSQEKPESKRGFEDKEGADIDKERDEQQFKEKDWHSEDNISKKDGGDKRIDEKEDTSKSSRQTFPEREEEHMRKEDYSDQDKDRVSDKTEHMNKKKETEHMDKKEDKPVDKKHERKPSDKGDEGHTFVSHARTRFEERDEKEHGDIWNKPTPRSEEPPPEHRHPLSSSSSASTVSWTGTAPSAPVKPDSHTTAWREEQQQNHMLHQQYLASNYSPSEPARANVAFTGVAIVAAPESTQSQATSVPSAKDLELEHERIARLQSETARLHGGIVPKDSDVSQAQSEIGRIERERLQQLQERDNQRQQPDERVVVPIVIETSTNLNRGNDNKRSSENLTEESERLHHVHDDIMEEIKSCPHLDSFDKNKF